MQGPWAPPCAPASPSGPGESSMKADALQRAALRLGGCPPPKGVPGSGWGQEGEEGPRHAHDPQEGNFFQTVLPLSVALCPVC